MSCPLTMSICCDGANSSLDAWFGLRGAGAFRRMLSSASLLFILKSGCLNSQACGVVNFHVSKVGKARLGGQVALDVFNIPQAHTATGRFLRCYDELYGNRIYSV